MAKGGRKHGTLQDWEELGRLTKELEEKLNEVCRKTWPMVPMEGCGYCLERMRRQLGRFKSGAENVMFEQIKDQARIDFFYGPLEKERK
jgi:hypothetical protein